MECGFEKWVIRVQYIQVHELILTRECDSTRVKIQESILKCETESQN